MVLYLHVQCQLVFYMSFYLSIYLYIYAEIWYEESERERERPEGEMTTSWRGLGMESSWTFMVMLPPVPENHPSVYMCRHSSDANTLASLTPLVSMYPAKDAVVPTSFPFTFPTAPSDGTPIVAADEDDGESMFLAFYTWRKGKFSFTTYNTPLPCN